MGLWHRLRRHGWPVFATLVVLNAVVAWLVVSGAPVEYRIPPEGIKAKSGHSYKYRLPEPRLLEVHSDDLTDRRRAESLLHEDGELLGPAHSVGADIADVGMGHFAHWKGKLHFSASDNSDPRANGRSYALRSRAHLPWGFLALSALPLLPFLALGLRRLTRVRLRWPWVTITPRPRWPRVTVTPGFARAVLVALLCVNALVAWLVVIGTRIEYRVPSERITPKRGHSYAYELPGRGYWRVRSDDGLDRRRAKSQLHEDGEPLGPDHGNHRSIASVGMGKFSHWQGQLFFSASDNSDPRANGRSYSLLSRARLGYGFLIATALPLLPFLAVGLYRLAGALFPRRDAEAGAETPARFARRGAAWAAVTAAGVAVAASTSHLVFWLGATLVAIGAVYVAANVLRAALGLIGRQAKLVLSHPLAFTLLSVGVFAMLFEGTLGYLESSASRRAKKARRQAETPVAAANNEEVPVPLLLPEAAAVKASRRGVLTLPEAWERRPVEVPGSIRSYYWHEVLHVHDQHSFRRTTPLPPREDGVYRIMVVGDSITYGQGVGARWIYPALIEEQLAKDYRVEVLNLGASGRQSEDILQIVKKFLPELEPDLVVYGACHNDFLPSGIGQYVKKYPFPMPESWKEFFLGRTRVAHFVDGAYDVIARALGLRTDFFDDILRDFEGYQERFARDVKEMNEVVRAQGLPAVVTMVFDQVPSVSRTSHQVTQHAERLLEAAGMTVIETEDYYRRFERRNLRVSQWEGHPDEEAHAIFAGMILDQIRSQVDFEPYRRTP